MRSTRAAPSCGAASSRADPGLLWSERLTGAAGQEAWLLAAGAVHSASCEMLVTVVTSLPAVHEPTRYAQLTCLCRNLSNTLVILEMIGVITTFAITRTSTMTVAVNDSRVGICQPIRAVTSLFT